MGDSALLKVFKIARPPKAVRVVVEAAGVLLDSLPQPSIQALLGACAVVQFEVWIAYMHIDAFAQNLFLVPIIIILRKWAAFPARPRSNGTQGNRG
jgi:hypothetical protein